MQHGLPHVGRALFRAGACLSDFQFLFLYLQPAIVDTKTSLPIFALAAAARQSIHKELLLHE